MFCPHSALTSKLLVFFFYEISTKLSKLLFCSFFLRHRLSSCYFFVPILIDIHLNHLPSTSQATQTEFDIALVFLLYTLLDQPSWSSPTFFDAFVLYFVQSLPRSFSIPLLSAQPYGRFVSDNSGSSLPDSCDCSDVLSYFPAFSGC